MDNIVTRSIFYILFSFMVLSFLIFLVNNFYTFEIYLLTVEYTLYEIFGLVLFISQFIFILSKNHISNYDIIINTVVCWLLYMTFTYLLDNSDSFYLLSRAKEDIYINRGSPVYHELYLLFIKMMKGISIDVYYMYLKNIAPEPAFMLFLLNISLHSFFKRKFKMNIIVRVVILLLVFLFNLYIWNPSYSVYMFIVSFFLLKNFGIKHEIY